MSTRDARVFKYFPKNALLSFCRNTKSAVHVPYVGWLILPCSALARTHDFKNFLLSTQVFCFKIFGASHRYLYGQSSMLSPLHQVITIVAWVCSFVSNTCKPLFMFLHLILCCPSPCCIPPAIMKCRVTILIIDFPCLATQFFPREDCLIRPLAPHFAYFRNLKYTYPPECRLPHSLVLFNTLSFWPRRLLSLLQSYFVVSRWLLPEYPRQVPPPVVFPHLLTAFNNDWLPHKYNNCSSISMSRSASKSAANLGRFELEPSFPHPTLHCCFFFFLLKLIFPAPILLFWSESSPAVPCPWNP